MNFHKLKGIEDYIYTPTSHLMESSLTMKEGVFAVSDGAEPMRPFLPRFSPIKEGDNLIPFQSGVINDILERMKEFFSQETRDKYKFLKNVHKMGIILHGKPGVGKTACARLLMMQEVANHGAICLDFTGLKIHLMVHTISVIRQAQATPIIAFYDEFEYIADDYTLLSFLDGAFSVDNTVFIGCTNFLKEIPDRIRNRKSRIKHLFEINTLPTAVYKEYLIKKIPNMEKGVLDEYVYKASEAGLTIDQLKNSLVDFYVEGATIEKAIQEAAKIDADETATD